eukprot:CAMPEP_0202456562 /NCGR_PEP_ID=MMETSP1360-20130828/13790_1 /ASSEMBLY_ACC=CAM_ASM_000848 /TAXON_ID=515479 /ORGANISM="Licmophora paradoxa, Strain CCMP2313" /LENGTH=60 /DNA_ID=CAMNT_0049076399 /DNA_START=147 /DNA_END=329 /DNA_ORIENTATION=+
MDGSKEQTMGDFRKKVRQADYRIKQTKPASPWKNSCEEAIRELKKGSGRAMVKQNVPRKL